MIKFIAENTFLSKGVNIELSCKILEWEVIKDLIRIELIASLVF